MKSGNLIILHDDDGRIYYHALELAAHRLGITCFYRESRIAHKIIRIIIGRASPSSGCWSQTFKNLSFRLKIPFLQDQTILLGMAPLDWRILLYSHLCKKNRVIYSNSWPEWHKNNFPRPCPFYLKGAVLRCWLKFLSSPHVQIVAVSSPVKTSILTWLRPFVPKTSVIPHCVHHAFLATQNDVSQNTGSFHRVILCGRLRPEKGIEIYIELAKAYPELEFHLVGDGPLRERVSLECQKRPNLFWHGYMSNKKQLAELFQQCDVLLNPALKIPGWEELFGMVLIEAMACGLIVVSSAHVGPKQLITPMDNGLLCSDGTFDDFSNALLQIRAMPESERIAMRNRAKLYAHNFSEDVISSRWGEILQGSP